MGADPDRVIVATAVLALLVGAIYILFGLLRLGFVARFFAKPVLDGFIIGLGLFIAIGQLPKLVGIDKPDGNTVMIALRTVADLGSWQGATVLTGGVALAALFLLARFAPRLPGALIVAAAGIVAVQVLGLTDDGVEVVGDIPLGFDLVAWSGVDLDLVWDLVPGALAIVLVGFSQSVAIAKAYGAKGGYRVDANQEMIGYGMANVGAGLLQGFTVTGSLSKSAAAEEAGGRTPIVLVTTAILVVPTVLFAAGLFRDLPEPVLAAIVIHAVSGMLDPSGPRKLWRGHRNELILALGALLGVVLIGIPAGVLVGVGLSFALLIHRIDHPHVAELGRTGDGDYRDLLRDPSARRLPGVLIYRFDAPLVFANAETFADDVDAAVSTAQTAPHSVILDFSTISEVDTTGMASLVDLCRRLRTRGVGLIIADPTGPVWALMSANGVTDVIEEQNIHHTVERAVAAVERPPSAGGDRADAE
ncbi:SulP family inorganic anion transporter [Nocardioides sambongensis]|uniref:SulP family inorganic anion transporter n=1 Tax=Nocardioides sambongensis TaxID=2589074 RepID=UPI0022AB877E|nr:SulP family inorganic anion transporter [Nocardioides sambongensis]